MMFKNIEKVKETFIGRVKNSQIFIDNYAEATTKKVAERTIDNFTNGIKNDVFGLQRLKTKTIEQKKRKGYPSPSTPLYGQGGDRSYSEMLIMRKLKNGKYRIRPSAKYHHSGKVKLKTLFFVHEYGMVIDNGKALIFEPARPAFSKAIKMTQFTANIDLLKISLYKYWNTGVNTFKRIVGK
jgi:hypothetical protein